MRPRAALTAALVTAALLALPGGPAAARPGGARPASPWTQRGALLVRLPPGGQAAPLIVLLHGDGGSPRSLFERWRRAPAADPYILAAPRCPRHLGCQGSFWRWGQEPSWLLEVIEEVARRAPVDRQRIYLASWSGGASYVGLVSRRLPPVFAALSLAGGGIPPEEGSCPGRPVPVHFMAGDRNPYHGLAISTREALAACRHAVTWRLLPGQGHGGEWAALDRRGIAAIVELFARTREPAR